MYNGGGVWSMYDGRRSGDIHNGEGVMIEWQGYKKYIGVIGSIVVVAAAATIIMVATNVTVVVIVTLIVNVIEMIMWCK